MTGDEIVWPGLRRLRLVRGALSSVALVLIVVGVPLGLYEMGGSGVFHFDIGQVARGVSSHQFADPDLVSHWLVRSALILAWVSWAWMTMCVMLEVRSKLTGRSSARLPASRSVQSLAACLVGAALAISTMGRVAASPKADGLMAEPATSVAPYAGSFAPGARSLQPLQVIDDLIPMERSNRSGPRIAAEPRFSPAAGEPSEGEWVPGDGGSGRALVPGATKQLEQSAPGPHESVLPRPSHLVASRETLWSIAGERLGSPLRWKEIAELNYHIRQRDGEALTTEHWVRPGWTLELPEAAGRAVATAKQGSIVPLHERKVPPMPLGGGIVGPGVVGLIDRMRRVQQRHRREGTYIRLPDRTQSRFEQRLRLGDGEEIVRAVDTALKLLVQAWRNARPDPPSVMGIKVHSESIELIVDRIDAYPTTPFSPVKRCRSYATDTTRRCESTWSTARRPGGPTCRGGTPLADPAAATVAALADPIDYPALARSTTPGDRVVLAMDRGVPQAASVVAAIVGTLIDAGVEADGISVLQPQAGAETGEENPCRLLPEAIRTAHGAGGAQPGRPPAARLPGRRRIGQAILVHRALHEADLIVPVGCLRGPAAAGYFGIHTALYPAFSDEKTLQRFRGLGSLGGSPRKKDLSARVGSRRLAAGHQSDGASHSGRRRGSHARLGRPQRFGAAPRPGAVSRGLGLAGARPGQPGDSRHRRPREQTWENVGRALRVARHFADDDGAIAVCCELAAPPGPARAAARRRRRARSGAAARGPAAPGRRPGRRRSLPGPCGETRSTCSAASIRRWSRTWTWCRSPAPMNCVAWPGTTPPAC